MILPRFGPHEDPGPDFAALLRLSTAGASETAGSGIAGLGVAGSVAAAGNFGGAGAPVAAGGSLLAESVRHGTTCVSVRFAAGWCSPVTAGPLPVT